MTDYNSKKNDILMIFVRFPEPGKVKTSLQPEISPENAARLYRYMIQEILSHFSEGVSFDIVIKYAPIDKRRALEELLMRHLPVIPQYGFSMGERMLKSMIWANESGYEKKIIMGSDTLHVSEEIVVAAMNYLDSHDVVLGPSEDGGCYLIGLKEVKEDLFADLDWDSGLVFKQALERAKSNNLKVAVLQELYGIDSISHLQRCYREIQTSTVFFPIIEPVLHELLT
ncbi:MAG: TIGR04282 family arsenosugar biosynthesis glycosyltransferase [Calditrichia bacterium]